MTPTTAIAGAAWVAANGPGYSKYRRALGDPARMQRALLMEYLRANAQTDFGRKHGFSTIGSVEAYQTRVPLASYADFARSIDDIARGRQHVLTRQPVQMMALSSGSVAAEKRIPYTRRLQQEFRRAIAPWVVDLYRRHPRAALGRAYWSITPTTADSSRTDVVPVGFEEDSEYVGGLAKWLVDTTLAVPACVRLVRDIETFRYVTLLLLLRRRDLALISVWHPTFLTLLLDALRRHWRSLLEDLKWGTISPPGHLPGGVERQIGRRPCPDRARELNDTAPDDYARIWPSLSVVSCWADGHAALYIDEIKGLLPRVEIQAKGLFATEGVVTLPFQGLTPLAVRSHFYEFLEDGHARLAHQLVPGRAYSVVMTTGGGLYRYRLEDMVEVNGFVGRTPSLRFLGKEDHVSDLCGEKLNETFVARALGRACAQTRVAPQFALVAPELTTCPPRYVLYLEVDVAPPVAFAGLVDELLAHNPHYRYCRELGQLAPLQVIRASSMFPRYAARCREAGQRLGNVKPLALSTRGGWTEVFAGTRAGVVSRTQSDAP